MIIAIVLGFPIALVFSWIYDITSHGIVRTPESRSRKKGEVVGSNLRIPAIDQSRFCLLPI